jgi:flagella basal body P-ring formation protein FlgA
MMLLALLATACLSIAGPNITAGDLARVVPAFAGADPALAVGYAPAPGVQRIMHSPEVHQLLSKLNLTGEAPLDDICFARPVAPLTNDAVLEAMHHTLGADAHIEISEVSRFPAPPGEVVFPREDLGPPPVAIWHGYVRYDSDKKFPVWARVKISVQTTRLIALEQLEPGVPIKASQVSVQTVEEFPQKRTTLTSIEQIEGCIPRRFISAKTPIWTDSIEPPNDISKGDRVTVVVSSGLAKLSFDAEAQNSGRRGDFVSFKNPDSGKLFRARVEGPDQAGVNTPSLRQ